VALVGPSGCGKSTLLRIIAGLEDQSCGDVAINDRNVNKLTPKDRDIAMVFQSYALYPHKNVFENIAFTLRMRGLPKSEINEKVRAAAGSLNLTSYLDRKPSQLSGGQRQRVAMGRALVRSPRVFLFDEPLSNLDAKLRVEMRTEIRRMHQDLNATSIYVTHDQVEAMTMADRIVVLHDGRIIQTGEPMELYDRPATRFVASFVGSPQMNLFEASSISGRHGSDLTTAGQTVRIPGLRAPEQRRIIWGIRPDDIALGAPGIGILDGRVEVVERTGGETLVFVDAAVGPFCVRTPSRTQIRVGEAVSISFEKEHVHLFDGMTDRRISPLRGA